MSEELSIGFVCVECGNEDSFNIYYESEGISTRCNDCGVEQVFGEREFEE